MTSTVDTIEEWVADAPDRPEVPAHRRTAWNAAELMQVEFPPPRWAVPGIVAQGLTLFAGAPKLGKSWLAMGLAVSVASGGRALGKIAVDQGDVLYLALEDNGRRLQKRLGSILGEAPAPARLDLATVCAPMPLGAERIDSWFGRHPDARLAIVDVFTKVRSRSITDRTNRYDADYIAMTELKNIADERDVAIVVLHHTRKAASDDFLDAVSGTHGLAGAADAVMVLSRSRGSANAVMKITGRDVEETDYALDFDAHTGTWSLLDGPAEDYELGDTRRAILQLIRDAGPLTPKEIADELGLKHDTARQTCRRMAEADQLLSDSGTYKLPLSPVTPVTPSLPFGDTSDRCDREEESGVTT